MIQIYENKYKIEHNDAVTMINTAYKYPVIALDNKLRLIIEILSVPYDGRRIRNTHRRIEFCQSSQAGINHVLQF